MIRLMRITRGVGILFGGFVSIVAIMSLVGLAIENFWARLIIALVVVIALPALLADRLLKRMNAGGLAMVADVFAIILLGMACMFVGAEAVTKTMFAREGDRYARSGSRTMARVTYFLAGVAPVFPDEKPAAKPAGSGSVAASGSNSASVPVPGVPSK